ncbi:MAG: ABC transporter ATP-binding protein [Polyangiaceae bacterium]
MIELEGIAKTFGDCRAIERASLAVREGEIHALVGENGAGKSTLMRVVAGLVRPDAGKVRVGGADVTGWTTKHAIARGVGMVHQHFMLVDTLTVAENLVLGAEPTRAGQLDLHAARAAVARLSKESGLEVPADARIADLPIGLAQRVEILKVLYRGAKVLILDEPTAVLSPPEVKEFLGVLEKLRDAGTTIVLVTHKLAEVMAVSSRVTVMRRGVTVAELETATTTPAELARAMVGREVDLEARPARASTRGDVVLDVRGLSVSTPERPRALDDVSFEIRAGEVLGFAGVEGNGQSELVEVIAGLRRASAGAVSLDGKVLGNEGVHDRVARGVAHVPEDRHRRGLVLEWSIEDNLILGLTRAFSRFGLLDRRRVRAHAEQRIRALDIRPTDPTTEARTLSGGNQQKIVIARELARGGRLLLAAQPTRGVDVGAIETIHAELRRARDAGRAILLVSAELSEILALSDRIAVMYRGKIVRLAERDAIDAEAIGELMTGARAGSPNEPSRRDPKEDE